LGVVFVGVVVGGVWVVGGLGVWGGVAIIIIVLIFRLAAFYLGTINDALKM
jgi:hypothetical protein